MILLPRHGLALGAACALLAGCVTFVAPYDEKIDQMTTALQLEVATEIEGMKAQEKPDCLYPAHAEFYRSTRVELGALEIRANAHEMNGITVAQIGAARNALDDFEKLHQLASDKGRCMSAFELSPVQRAFDQMTGAILKLELAKKRGL